jgi:hypothetical protein
MLKGLDRGGGKREGGIRRKQVCWLKQRPTGFDMSKKGLDVRRILVIALSVIPALVVAIPMASGKPEPTANKKPLEQGLKQPGTD